MKNTIYRAETLSPFDLRGTEEHLSAMAAQGWRLEHIGRFLWKYRRAEPADIHYAVTCPPAAGENGDLSDRLYFEDLCASAGWEKVTDWEALQIYTNEAENPTPLETDEALRLESVRQSMRRTFLRDRRNNILCEILLLLPRFMELLTSPHAFFLSNISQGIALACLMMITANLASILAYRGWFRRSRRSVEEGGGLAAVPRSYRTISFLSSALLALLILVLVMLVLLPDEFLRIPRLTFSTLGVILSLALAWVMERFFRQRQFEWQTQAAIVVLSTLALLAIVSGLAEVLNSGQRLQPPAAPSYAWNGQDWDSEPQALPMTMEDLTGYSWPHVRRWTKNEGRTLFASQRACTESAAQEDGREAYLHYVILDIPNETIRQSVLNDMLDGPVMLQYEVQTSSPWGAEAAYRLYYPNGQPTDEWLISWPGRIIALRVEGISFQHREMSAVCRSLSPNPSPKEVRS